MDIFVQILEFLLKQDLWADRIKISCRLFDVILDKLYNSDPA